ncbi:MAG: hypothetical protein AB4042_20120 [Leptolyngbyaceae cyanobacterium]
MVQSRQTRQSVSPSSLSTTASLQKLADSRFGSAPNHTMSLAQSLSNRQLHLVSGHSQELTSFVGLAG